MKGKVINSISKEPIKLVNIKINNSNIGTTTNETGNFELPALNTNSLVSFSHIGFDTLKTNYSKSFTIIELNPSSYSLPIVSIKPKDNLISNLALLFSGFFLLSSTIFNKSK
jgi:hypothetical protein